MILGDSFACTVQSNRSSAVLMTDLADFGFGGGEKKQTCLVHLRLDPPAHRQSSEELPVWSVCSFQFNGIFVKERVGLIRAP